MIKRYRKKFILTTLLSLLGFLAFLIGLINVINKIEVDSRCDNLLDQIVNKVGPFGNEIGIRPEERDPEIAFQARYFSITVDLDNNIQDYDLSHIAAIDESRLDDYLKVLDKNKERGYFNEYRYLITDDSNSKTITYLQCERELEQVANFFHTSLYIGLGLYVIVGIIIYLFSNLVIKPFIDNVEKQKRFITDASHELKTPLTIINANVDIMEMDNGESEWTNNIKKQTNRLRKLTDELTLISKMDEDRQNYELSNINISAILNDSINDFTALTRNDKHINSALDQDVYIDGNETLINELFFILLDNAFKYSLGDIDISLKKENRNVLIEFSNDADVENENLDRLFNRFYRLDESRNSEAGGSGIGLSIAKAIVEIHKGRISALGKDKKIFLKIIFKI